MKFALFVLAAIASGAVAASSDSFDYTAVAVFVNENGTISGTVRFSQNSDIFNYTTVTVETGAMLNGTFELIVRQWGNISTFQSSGSKLHSLGMWNSSDNTVSGSQSINNVTLFGPDSIVGRTVAFVTKQGLVIIQAVIGLDVDSPADTKNVPAFRTSCVFQGIGQVYGNATIVYTPSFNGSSVYAILSGASLTAHAIHIHQWADITNLTLTGEHFNPFNAAHGIPPFPVRHAGDLGNIYFADGDNLEYKYENNTLLRMDNMYYQNQSFIGRTIVIHTAEDNCQTFGSRLTACVIGIADDQEDSDYDVAPWANVSQEQNTSGCAVSTTGPQTTGPQTTGPQTTGPQTTGPQTTGTNSTTGPQTTGPQTTGPQTTGTNSTTGPQTTGPQTTGTNSTTGPQTTGPQTTGPQTTGPQTTGTNSTTGVQTTGPQTTGVPTTTASNQTTGVQTTGVQATTGVQTTGVQATTGVQTTGVQPYNYSTTAAATTFGPSNVSTTGVPHFNFTTTGLFNTSTTAQATTGNTTALATTGTTGSAATVAISIQLVVAAVCALFML